jgi:hypothetical protein
MAAEKHLTVRVTKQVFNALERACSALEYRIALMTDEVIERQGAEGGALVRRLLMEGRSNDRAALDILKNLETTQP